MTKKKRIPTQAYNILVGRFGLKKPTIKRRIERNDLVMITALKEAVEQVQEEIDQAIQIKRQLHLNN